MKVVKTFFKNMNNYRNYVFLFVFIFIILLGMSTLIRKEKHFSNNENRNLIPIPHFTIDSFLTSEFQDTFTKSLSDQFLLAETTKKIMNKYTKLLNYSTININICKNKYVKIGKEHYVYDCNDGIVHIPVSYTKEENNWLNQEIYKINTNIKTTYHYYILDSYNFDFETNKKIYNFETYFNKNYSEFNFNNYDEFEKYFYKTDHHWNYKGSYKAYREIIQLLLGKNEELINPRKITEYDVDFDGSFARVSKSLDFNEKFKTYDYKSKEFNTIINKTEKTYGKYKEYHNGEFKTNNLVNHYGEFYGYDEGELILDFYNNKDKENLLVLSNSFSNSNIKLIASHFHKTYKVDVRHYEKDMEEEFNYEKYIKTNDIDKVVFIGNINFYKDFILRMEAGEIDGI